ncbi:MAG: hypothetical protein JNN26_27360 [Candidatus Obscuribacter sp.]|nr:hypothetical protein [Candidatus Obscuribacter sp.]
MEQYNNNINNNNQPRPYDNNGNNYWPPRHPNDYYHPQQQQLQQQQQQQQQQRQEFFERPNFEIRSFASDNNRYYDDRPSYPMPTRTDNNFNQNQPAHFNNARNGYNNNNHHQLSNYDRDYMHGRPQV